MAKKRQQKKKARAAKIRVAGTPPKDRRRTYLRTALLVSGKPRHQDPPIRASHYFGWMGPERRADRGKVTANRAEHREHQPVPRASYLRGRSQSFHKNTRHAARSRMPGMPRENGLRLHDVRDSSRALPQMRQHATFPGPVDEHQPQTRGESQGHRRERLRYLPVVG